MAPTIRLLPLHVAGGPWQMAADEVMLESAVAGRASLRVYRWAPATLSLGYFQRHADRLADPCLAALPWVRRATGGGAIIHDRELTYAIALPAAIQRGLSPVAWHNRIHESLTKVLHETRVAAEMVAGSRLPLEKLGFLCFAVPQPGDVVLAGRKIVGGAQRLKARALLQHGSIQLNEQETDGMALARRLAEALGWEVVESDWLPTERQRIEGLAGDKYGQAWWNQKR